MPLDVFRKRSTDIIRVPMYGPIPIDPTAIQLIETKAFQRLRHVRQLALAYVVYPSATHTRFEHSVGVYHLAREIIQKLLLRGELDGRVSEEDLQVILWSGLLHDLGQSVAGHLLEEYGVSGYSHEEAGGEVFRNGEVRKILEGSGIPDAPDRIARIVAEGDGGPLAGIIAGNCDADKIDYLIRDAHHCGLPIGFDFEHLRDSICLLRSPRTGELEVGIDERGLVSFEQMLYSKNVLFRRVYFHERVRCAMAMLRALLLLSVECGILRLDELHQWSDDRLFVVLWYRFQERALQSPEGDAARMLLERLNDRNLFITVARLPLSDVPPLSSEEIDRVESVLRARLGLGPGELVMDVPNKPSMLATDLHVRMRDGSIRNVQDLGPEDGFALNEVGGSLYHASGHLRVYASRPLERHVSDDLRATIEEVSGCGATC